ncbi:PREDICTED: DNA replication complex GINS protein PSF3 isoform X2 [Ceratosolen solmsi marchali]|uniref:DNA replication complex GINS protein PSF3 n=1 Tax=Ceratosolen solmsi marchali TaxID=326594 RepID=A0AAJ6YCS1_9HYME|nr:PREDICTED: DNA replication complex GINS protein PSF3 isoform X2 [Ceratosolen solmsi marchali]
MTSSINQSGSERISITEERIQAEFEQSLPNLGYLCASSKKDDIAPKTKLDIPLWLADALCRRGESIINWEIPKIFKDSYKEILEADACSVELCKWNQYFYELGLRLPRTTTDDNHKLAEFLLEVFKSRFRIIMDSEQNPFSTPLLRGQLSTLEKKLLVQGNSGKLQLLTWLNKGVKHIETSDVIDNIRKRKRLVV